MTSGLAVGVLGPLVHVGAIVGSGLTRGRKARWAGGALGGGRLRFFEQFHNDADRRDYISMGAAGLDEGLLSLCLPNIVYN